MSDETWIDCPHAGYDKAEGGCPACEDIVFAVGKCPDRIWLQIEDDGEVIPSDGERTFCKDKINDSDVEYLRADRRAKPADDDSAPDGGWIACSAARPHAGTPVEMRWRDGSTEIGEWRDSRQCMLGTRAGECGPGLVSVLADNLPADDVTHWRPLPAPPATTTTDKGEA